MWKGILPTLHFRYKMLPKDENVAEAITHIENETESVPHSKNVSHHNQLTFRKSLWSRRDRYAHPKSGAPLF